MTNSKLPVRGSGGRFEKAPASKNVPQPDIAEETSAKGVVQRDEDETFFTPAEELEHNAERIAELALTLENLFYKTGLQRGTIAEDQLGDNECVEDDSKRELNVFESFMPTLARHIVEGKRESIRPFSVVRTHVLPALILAGFVTTHARASTIDGTDDLNLIEQYVARNCGLVEALGFAAPEQTLNDLTSFVRTSLNIVSTTLFGEDTQSAREGCLNVVNIESGSLLAHLSQVRDLTNTVLGNMEWLIDKLRKELL